MKYQLQRALSIVYPDQCILCETRVEQRGGLCGDCWKQTPFISGLVCDLCGVSLPGYDDHFAICDDCIRLPRPWSQGRSVLQYKDFGRRMVLALKHGDRLDLIPSFSDWLARTGEPLFTPDTILVPVPDHWSRRLSRKYNQAAELCRGLHAYSGLHVCANALVRTKKTRKQDGMTPEERFANIQNAIEPHDRHGARLAGSRICIVDDVMTTGATFAAATDAALKAGSKHVSVLALARVTKDA